MYYNLVLKIIHCAGSGGVGLFYRNVFPHRKIFVLCVSFSVYLLYALHDIESVSVKDLIGFALYFPYEISVGSCFYT